MVTMLLSDMSVIAAALITAVFEALTVIVLVLEQTTLFPTVAKVTFAVYIPAVETVKVYPVCAGAIGVPFKFQT